MTVQETTKNAVEDRRIDDTLRILKSSEDVSMARGVGRYTVFRGSNRDSHTSKNTRVRSIHR